MEANISLLGQIEAIFACGGKDVRSYSPLTLAYIGDAVYDLVIRSIIVGQANRPANELHGLATKYVRAGAQARMAEVLLEMLSEEEAAVYRRGYNAKPRTTAKNASLRDYHKATGYEALLGYLYLSNRVDRLLLLVKTGIEKSGMEI